MAYLKETNNEVKIVNYLLTPPNSEELKSIIEMLQIKPIDLVRQKETLWISLFKDKNLNDSELVEAMVANPILIERPIVINGTKAIVARPFDKVKTIL
jgi:arsenate reductase